MFCFLCGFFFSLSLSVSSVRDGAFAAMLEGRGNSGRRCRSREWRYAVSGRYNGKLLEMCGMEGRRGGKILWWGIIRVMNGEDALL